MLQVCILSTGENWHSQALAQAWQEHGVEPRFEEATALQARLGSAGRVLGREIELDRMDLVLVRGVPGGSLEQVIYRMDALHQLENQGVRVVNSPGAIEKMVDKYYTSSLLQQVGLRVPETVVTENLPEAMAAFHDLGGDVVVKPLFGSRGSGMVRVRDEDTAGRVFYALRMNNYVLYLQRFIPHGNADMRVLVQNDECLAAMRRVSENWKNNISQGAIPEAYTPDEEEVQASLRAAEVVGAEYCGVDLLRGEDGDLYVLEVNSMPAWQGLQQVTDFDIAGRLVRGFIDRMVLYQKNV
jgi:RimK family alpha-L-glutamate ligase